jgi:hypothetical protein
MKLFNLMFGMCRSHHAIEVKLHEERKARNELSRDIKNVKAALFPRNPPSCVGSETIESIPPTPFQQRIERYKSDDPYSQYFASHVSGGQMRFDSQLGGMFEQPNDAYTTPPEQQRATLVEQLADDLFGTTSGMTTSPLLLISQLLFYRFFDLSLYIRSSAYWAHLHNYMPHDV